MPADYIARTRCHAEPVEVCVIRAAELNKLGLFHPRGTPLSHVTIRGQEVAVSVEPGPSAITLGVVGSSDRALFRIVTSSTPFGSRYRFICNYTGKQVDKLYIHCGYVRTRHEFEFTLVKQKLTPSVQREIDLLETEARLAGTDGRGPARGGNRVRLEALLTELQVRDGAVRDASGVGRASLGPERFKRDVEAPNGTKQALARAAYVSPHYFEAIFRKDMLRLRSSMVPDRLGVLNSPLANVADFPALSIDAFAKRWRECETELCLSLSWEEEGIGMVLAYGVGEPGSPKALLIRHGMAFDAHCDIVLVSKGAQVRPKLYMSCPVLGKASSHLYYRDGRFACADAQRLVHPSRQPQRLKVGEEV